MAIIISHPIQYNAPWFRMLAERKKIEIKVFYTLSQSETGSLFDDGFNKSIEWDIPLLKGYEYTFVKNVAITPKPHYFWGIRNPTLNSEIEEWNPDAVLVFGWLYESHLKALRYFHKKKPVLFRGDSTILNRKNGVKAFARKIFLRWIYSMVDIAFYVGTNNKKYYLNFGLRPDQLVFAPHAIDNERFSKQVENAITTSWREKLNIPKDALVFLFAGKLEPVKNPDLLTDAFLEIKSEMAHLVMVGNGILEKHLKEKCSSNPNIHFVDFQNQSAMPGIYQFCDVFVLTSVSETWGLAINEAMACSKAILVSDYCGATVDLVEEGKNGYSFKANDRVDLVAKMNRLISQKESLKKMGEASFEKIKQYSFGNICESIEQFLQSKQV